MLVVDSVTRIPAGADGSVLIAGSHGGIYSGFLAAKAHVRGVILHDAGVGKDGAGIASLGYLARLGYGAATVAHTSARVGDGRDIAKRGVVSHVNEVAAALGCAPGDTARACALRLCLAEATAAEPPPYRESRFLLLAEPGKPEVHGLDSISLAAPADLGRALVSGSHGGILGGDPASALKVDAAAAVFNDAGIGIDDAGIGRLPALDKRGIPGATVGSATARIGDAHSSWDTGVVSCVNATAVGFGASAGMTCQEFVDRVLHPEP